MPKKKTQVKKGGNQYKVDPRQADFLNRYLDPESDTYGNALQSALAAGYEENYAKNITDSAPKWLVEKVGSYGDRFDEDLLREKHLALLNKKEVIARNNNKTGEIDIVPTGEIDVNAVRAGLDMAYKIKSTYAPEKHANININVDASSKDKAKKALQAVFGGGDTGEGGQG